MWTNTPRYERPFTSPGYRSDSPSKFDPFPGDHRDSSQEDGREQAGRWNDGPHAGKGPKGYRRSDEQIAEEANQRLTQAGHIDASEMEVDCKQGVVRLSGKADNRWTKRNAEWCVEDVYGVKDVMNTLTVDESAFQR